MIRLPIRVVAAMISSLFALSGMGLAAVDPLAPAPGFTPSLTFTDTISEGVHTQVEPSGEPGEPPFVTREQVTTVTTTIKVTANITGIDLATIDADTAFELSLGAFVCTGTLGDAPGYVKGKTSAFFPFDFNDDGVPRGTHGLRLSWSATRLTATITRSSNDAADPGELEAGGLAGVTEPVIRFTDEATLSFGDLTSATHLVYVKGSSKVRTVTYGSGDFAEFFDLTSGTLTGALDVAKPTLTIASPKNGAVVGSTATVTGKATDSNGDGEGSPAVQYTRDLIAGNWQDAVVTPVAPFVPEGGWGSATATWTFNLSGLPVGSNTVWIRSVDRSGNVSPVTALTLVNAIPPLLTSRWDGLVSPLNAGTQNGVLTLQVDAKGVASGKVTLEGSATALPFVGKVSGTALTAEVKRKGKPSLMITGQVASLSPATAADASITGTIKENGAAADMASFTMFRSPWSTTVNAPVIAQGRAHYGLAKASTAPLFGHGYLTLVVGKTGTAAVGGKLADGTTIVFSSVLGASGQVAFYAPLYGGKGCVTNELRVNTATGVASASAAIWKRPAAQADKQFPAGISIVLPVTSAKYAVPLTGVRIMGLGDASPNAQALWEGDGVSPAVGQNFTVSALNKATVPVNDAAFKITSLAPATGLIAGSFKLPGTTAVAAFNGLVVGNTAFGLYVAPAATGQTEKAYGSVQIGSIAQ